MSDAENETNGDGSGGSAAQFALQKIYIKDMSYESPHAPDVFIGEDQDRAEPQIQLNLKNSHSSLAGDNFEVVLHASLLATLGDRTLFMIEIDQAGIFQIRGYDEEQRRTLIGTYCPSTLFPYLREAISSMIGKGGFPAMLLQPINFDALFMQAMQQDSRLSGNA